MYVELIANCLHAVRYMKLKPSRCLEIYSELYIVFRCKFTEVTAFFLLKATLVISVLVNTVSLKGYNVFPVGIYPLVPVFACLVLASIEIAIPDSIAINSTTNELLESLRSSNFCRPGVGNSKWFRKKLRSLQPTRMAVGLGFVDYRFFYFQKSTKATYYGAVFSYTITMLMSVSRQSLERGLEVSAR
jgi:hypothetical protein